ncbi:MAG: NosD domain-containing protein [Candidatus Pacearchaeota archaeon]
MSSLCSFHYALLALFLFLVIGGLIYSRPSSIVSLQPAVIINLTSCGNLNVTGAMYQLQNNIIANGTCFTVSAENITFAGQGLGLVGNISNYGFIIQKSNFHIYNLSLSNFSRAFYSTLPHTQGHSFSDLDLFSNFYGFSIFYSSNSLFENISLSNSSSGISLTFSHNNTLRNIRSNFSSVPVLFANSQNNSVFHVSLNNSGNGLWITASNDNYFSNITSSGASHAIEISSSNNNTFYDLLAYNNSIGLYVLSSSNTFAYNGIYYNNTNHGIFSWFDKNSYYVNQTSYNNDNGAFVWFSKNISFKDFSSFNNTYGSFVWHSDNTSFISSTLSDNDNLSSLLVQFSNYTNILDSYVDSYNLLNFANSSYGLSMHKSSFGSIYLLDYFYGSGSNLSNTIRLENNSAVVESSTNPGLNKSARVSLFVNNTLATPVAYRNGLPCSVNVCSLVSVNGNEYSFNVASWTNYSVGSSVCGDLICNSAETCSTCSVDCGACSSSGSGGSGGGGGGGSGGGGSSGGGVISPQNPTFNATSGANSSISDSEEFESTIELNTENKSNSLEVIWFVTIVLILSIVLVAYFIVRYIKQRKSINQLSNNLLQSNV